MLVKFFRVLVSMSIAVSFFSLAIASDASTVSAAGLASPREMNGEFCPAQVADAHALPTGEIAMRLISLQPRTLSATMEMQTDTGWFQVQIPAATLALQVEHWKSGDASWDIRRFTSKPIFIALPSAPKTLQRVWVTSATVSSPSDPWFHVGTVACLPVAVLDIAQPNASVPQGTSSASHAPLVATAAAAPSYACAHPFEPARVAAAFGPRIPRGVDIFMPVRISFLVTIGASGNILATEARRESSNFRLNRAALDTVLSTEFRPAIVFCRPAPGRYPYTVDYAPN